MTDAPGRIFGSWRGGSGWRFADCAETGCAEVRVYIRADLHQQALDAAREEGRKVGLKEAAEWHDLEVTHYGSACGQKDGVDFALVAWWHQQHAEAIRAMIDKPADPVVEAARVLADHVRERHWKYYLIEMPLTKDGQGPATFGEDAVSVSYEVWEAETFRTVSSHVYLPDAIEAWLYTLAQKQGE